MKNFLRLSAITAITGIFIFLAYGLGATLYFKGVASSDTAGWIQAAGATLGIIIAIWVPYKQQIDSTKSLENERKDSTRRLCLAFRDELSMLKERFDNPNVQLLLKTHSLQYFDRELPIPKHRFPIFHSMVGRLTGIDDERIRRLIVHAYDAANALIDAAALNNRYLNEFKEMERLRSIKYSNYTESEMDHKRNLLIDICKQMRFRCELTINKVNEVLPLLDAAINDTGT
ncbi:hypothetical protein HH212_26305 [Massilia forsythiae]|uniref:DUF4760 domain-containing protein n=1 Tax=Massilia forsythiae TaxID=2728020 RepID=A0A7Z2ZUV5_9BURK|nr:hypothetical protein [Massilia forsythiae]QJE03071.1 hypothetical protein HH212_26305 [Massilia forsythiae]